MTLSVNSETGLPSRGDLSAPLEDLIAALRGLADMDFVDQARDSPGLIEKAKKALSLHRAFAMLAAHESGISQLALARRLGVSRRTVTDAIKLARVAGLVTPS